MKWTKSRAAAASGVPLCLAVILLLSGGGVPERLVGPEGKENASAKAQGITERMATDPEVARINGYAVTAAELKYAMGLQRTQVIEYFRDTYNQAYEGNFWELEIGGENPLEMLKREALTSWTRSRILLEMGHEEGLVDSTDFGGLLSEMERENKRRAQAAVAGIAVFGPAELDEGSFIPYYLSNLEVALRERMTVPGEHGRDDEPAREDQVSSIPEEQELTFTRISIAYRSKGQGVADNKPGTQQLLSEVRQLLLEGRSPEEAISELRNDNASFPDLTLSSESLDSANARVYFREQGQLYAWLTGERESGEISPVMDEGFTGEWVMAVLGDVKPQKPETAAEERNKKAATETGFGRELEQRIRSARIELTEPGYSGLQMQ
ncbi:hypothetical protein P40081_19320 [Paenibacillus sp. FSL P4-0081]|jgi:hypothetical protein|uniref:hypothetical protein n=1 Tax=unclassified Paenibacillus TaxID=185978 RepID=UPI0004F650E3|nr:hypothetical protein [Paenibacillus sp. FSL P4-0081]AIQ30070.1 hypothetical protein P40081_19320 [Paenibacillus sp. FSL P4-0081]